MALYELRTYTLHVGRVPDDEMRAAWRCGSVARIRADAARRTARLCGFSQNP